MRKNGRPTGTTPAFAAVSTEQIETVNQNRILVTCGSVLLTQGINLVNPQFWQQPRLWWGAGYLAAVGLIFIALVLLIRAQKLHMNLQVLHALFWSLLSVGFFPFLERDASGSGDRPMNCIILCMLLICAPLLRVKELCVIFSAGVVINVAAALAAGNTMPHYYLELVAINVISGLLAKNLHGRYFELLTLQQHQYDAYLSSVLEGQELQLRLEKERAANAAKTDFLARMSHDLRTPLNGIIGMADLAQQPGIGEEKRGHYLHEISLSGRYLQMLINDVLDMSRIESDKLTLHPEPYSMAEFVETVNSVMETPCAQKNLHFEVQMPSGSEAEALNIDRLRFDQIVLNLLNNAVKFTPAGGRITLRMQDLSKKGDRVRKLITVQDTGLGMSAAFLPHAFDSFAQEHENDQTTGTGLGLAIVKKLVGLMGGTVRIESTEGVGTTVFVELEVQTVSVLKPAAAAAGKTELKGRRVLLCEDNEINAEIADAMLSTLGVAVEHAGNGLEGVERFKASAPGYYDAVLMDIRMPVMDGLEATRALRALPRDDAAQIPILALTANAFDEDRERCVAAGMNGHLSKPVSAAQLCAGLESVLRVS